jgi:phage baseplate assembly protein V
MLLPDYSSADFNQTSLNLLRAGIVTDARYGAQGPEVRISYPDRDLTSDWLPVGQPASGGLSVHVVPRLGTNVIVGHLGTGIERGVVLGTVPTQNGGAVIPDHINTAAMLFDDGTQISHNPMTGATQLVGSKTMLFVAGSDIALHSDGVQTIHCSGKCNITSGGDTVVTAANVTIVGGTITLAGNVHITGDLTVDGTVRFGQDGSIATHLTNDDGAGGGS